MAVTIVDTLEMFRGDDFVFLFTFFEEDEVTPINITDWSFKLTLKLHPEMTDDDAAFQIDLAPADVEYPLDGTVTIRVPAIDAAELIATTYYYDLQREWEGIVATVLKGKLKVVTDVTRRMG